MSTTAMTEINSGGELIMTSLNAQVRKDEDSSGIQSFSEDDRSSRFHELGPSLDEDDDNLIDPEAVDEVREIETRMVRYRERSVSLVAGSFFPSAKSEAGSGNWECNETNPDSPLNISSLFPSNKSETDDSSPEFSCSNSDSIMSIFPPAMSEIDSPDNYEIIFRNPSIPSYYHFFPPDMSDSDSYGSSTPNHQLSIPSYYLFFPPDMSDTDSYGSSTPNHQLSIPSLYFPPNDLETDNSSSLVNGISLDERVVIYPKIDPEVVIPRLNRSGYVVCTKINPGGYVVCTKIDPEVVVRKTWVNKQKHGRVISIRRRQVKLPLSYHIVHFISGVFS